VPGNRRRRKNRCLMRTTRVLTVPLLRDVHHPFDNGEKKELRAIISVNTGPIISRWDGMKWVSYEPQSQHLPNMGRQFLTTVTSTHPHSPSSRKISIKRPPHLPSHQQCDGNSRTIRRRRTAWLHELPFGNLGGFQNNRGH